MAAPILTSPPASWRNERYVIPPDALPGFTILYTDGRNDGKTLTRKRRTAIHTEITHIMGNGKVTPQGFANSMQPSDSTLAEISTFPAGNYTTGKPVLLQALPLDIIGAGSVAGGATGLTHESSNSVAGDTNTMVWDAGHVALKVALTAWLIRNPLDWPKLDIRYQICRSPYGPTAELGGLGDHTMWDTCGIQAGGTNPWTLFCKSCPGWRRRGTQRKVQFPNSAITDIPFEVGNFRDYYEAVGVALVFPPEPTRRWNVLCSLDPADGRTAKFDAGGGTIRWIANGNEFAQLVAVYGSAVKVTPAFIKAHRLVGDIPSGDVTKVWSVEDFGGVVGAQGPAGPAGAAGTAGAQGPKGDPGEPATLPAGYQFSATVQ